MEMRMSLQVQRAFNPTNKHKPVPSVSHHHPLIYSAVGEESLHSKLYGKSLFLHQFPLVETSSLRLAK